MIEKVFRHLSENKRSFRPVFLLQSRENGVNYLKTEYQKFHNGAKNEDPYFYQKFHNGAKNEDPYFRLSFRYRTHAE